ncbi:MAG: hypothetical protein JO218_14065 [Burkholderiales bacterium]|nr:hypothetical protein [Burkholderiales bacterium]
MSSADPQRAETALSAYLNLLKNKGAATNVVTRRKHFLRHLLTALESEEGSNGSDDAGYRRSVDATLSKFPQEQQIEIITTAREFHPFWLGDLKTIARLNAADALSLQHIPVDVRGSLFDMFQRLDSDAWAKQEQVCLNQYLAHLGQSGADDAMVDIRERLLLLLLYVIRHADPTPFAYRAGVDAMLTLFTKEDTRRVFLELAREFFYFWNGFHEGQASTLARAA